MPSNRRGLNWNNCRTYYHLAFFVLLFSCLLDVIALFLSFLRLSMSEVYYSTGRIIFGGLLATAIHFLIQYSNMPHSDHWLTHSQTHVLMPLIIALLTFTHSSSFPQYRWASDVCRWAPTLIRRFNCQVLVVAGMMSSIAPFPLLIAAWIVYISAVRAFRNDSAWREANIADINESSQGGQGLLS